MGTPTRDVVALVNALPIDPPPSPIIEAMRRRAKEN